MKRAPLAAALLCSALGLSWQLLTVHFNYGGNLTALFCHGSQYPVPQGLAFEHIYVFPDSGGYDGQSYHYMAHDPLDRSDIGRAVPDPSLRYPRILLPAMAHLLAFGRSAWIDDAYLLCELIFLGLGAWWLGQLLERAGMNAWLAVLYVTVPVAIISLDRMLVDLAATSLALGFAVYADSGRQWRLYLIVAAAALCRETGYLLFGAYALRLLSLRRYRDTVMFATALLPAMLWTLWVRSELPGGDAYGPRSLFPLRGMLDAIVHPRHYRFSALAVFGIRALEYVQLGGIVLSIVLAFGNLRKLGLDVKRNACFLWACFAIVLPPGIYDDPISGARILAPLLMFQFLEARRLTRVPLLLVTPRVWLQLTPQVLGVLRGLF